MPAEFQPQQLSIFDQYDIEEFTSAHFPLLKELYKNAFGAVVNLLEMKHRFNTIALGCPVIGFIAIHKQTQVPSAYYGVFPFKAIIKDEIVQAAQSGDTMTHSHHRRKGLFAALANLTYEKCKELGIKILIGQPNESSYHGLVKSLGWEHIDEIIRWDIKLRLKTFPLAKIARRNIGLQKYYSNYSKAILKKKVVNAVQFHNPLNTGYAKVYRDKNYLDYKETPDKFFIRIENITIWVRLTDIFWIGDFSDYEKITPAFIKKIRRLAFILGYNTISFNLNKSISLPSGLQSFTKNSSQASCFLYFDEQYRSVNFILTAADSDTW